MLVDSSQQAVDVNWDLRNDGLRSRRFLVPWDTVGLSKGIP